MLHRAPQHKDFGVFLSVASGGWIVSSSDSGEANGGHAELGWMSVRDDSPPHLRTVFA